MDIIKIGIVMKTLLDPIVSKSNDLLESGESGVDIVGFIQNNSLSEEVPGFAVMNISEAYTYEGLLIATDIDSAEKTLSMATCVDRWFYVSDAEWVSQRQRTFDQLLNIYNNPNMKIITSTQSMARDVESLWNSEVFAVVADFDMGQISETYKKLLLRGIR